LLKALEANGRLVRCLARRPEFLQARVGPGTKVVAGDCLERSTLLPAMAGAHTAYYLVHAMGSPRNFEEEDRQSANNFASAAAKRVSKESSIWVVSATPPRNFPLILKAVRKWARFFGAQTLRL